MARSSDCRKKISMRKRAMTLRPSLKTKISARHWRPLASSNLRILNYAQRIFKRLHGNLHPCAVAGYMILPSPCRTAWGNEYARLRPFPGAICNSRRVQVRRGAFRIQRAHCAERRESDRRFERFLSDEQLRLPADARPIPLRHFEFAIH